MVKGSTLLFAAAAGLFANCLNWLNHPAARTAVVWELLVCVLLVVVGVITRMERSGEAARE